jgi:type II secretory pathway component PulC
MQEAGIVKEISGRYIALSISGEQRVLHEGDVIYNKDVIKNIDGEKIVIENDGKILYE